MSCQVDLKQLKSAVFNKVPILYTHIGRICQGSLQAVSTDINCFIHFLIFNTVNFKQIYGVCTSK